MRAFYPIPVRLRRNYDSLTRDDLLFELENAYGEIDTLTKGLERKCCVGRTASAFAAALQTIFSNP